MISRQYRTGEFARLCGVTKHTLYHYDQIGLLKPGVVGENGYRYYTADQVDRMSIIAVLKEVGTPLEQIRDYLDCQNPRLFLSVLEEKLLELEKEEQRIQSMHRLLSETIRGMEETFSAVIGQIYLEESPTEYLIATPVVSTGEPWEEVSLRTVCQHLQYCAAREIPVGFHIGSIAARQDLHLPVVRESCYFSRISGPVEDPRLIVKPAGTYGVMYHQGNYDTLAAACRQLEKQLKEQGLTPVGDIYEEDAVDCLAERDPDRYILRLSVRVEGEAPGFLFRNRVQGGTGNGKKGGNRG